MQLFSRHYLSNIKKFWKPLPYRAFFAEKQKSKDYLKHSHNSRLDDSAGKQRDVSLAVKHRYPKWIKQHRAEELIYYNAQRHPQKGGVFMYEKRGAGGC